ncbi:peptide chain release factor 1 [Verrucomicrobia bacterium IMCC26134]|nr:peptide chain release factor 1 [Verrucomicrobia bacterium IMCC26134]
MKHLPTQIQQRLVVLRVRSADVEEKFVLGSGRGGQKIQKTSSCVWLRHGPTGVEVRCQNGRFQAVNREQAWTGLCDKLEERKRAAAAKKQAEKAKTLRLNRPRSRNQKVRLVQAKRDRAKTKSTRGRVGAE